MNYKAYEDYLQGTSAEAYLEMGAHLTHEFDQDGARFSVYAPNASQVLLIGSFNQWTGYAMKRLPNGIWTIFVEGVREMDFYKFRVCTNDGGTYDRMDPFAFYSELRPDTASIVYQTERFVWTDQSWLKRRGKSFESPVNIYELHAGSWKRNEDGSFYSYDQLGDELIPYLCEMGYTHLELLPLAEHPFDGSWGYQITGYYSATSRYGTPRQLMRLIDRCHNAGIGVLMDFVPVHFVTDFYALHQFDGGFLYESEFSDKRFSEWGTALFDFTKPHVISFLKSAADFWISRYHVDGLRYDAVSNLIYNGGQPENGLNEAGIWFAKNVNFLLQSKHPGVMLIAEDSSNYLKVTAPVVYGGLGFDYKWNFGWMHDTLEYLAAAPSQRPALHNKMTFSLDYFYQEIYILPFSHDEVVHGKKTILDKIYGTYEEKFAQLRSLYLFMYTHPGKKLNFMGNELGEFKEWDEDEQLGWNVLIYPAHDSFHGFLKDLQKVYLREPALYKMDYNSQSFQWLDLHNAGQCVFAYKRSDLEQEEVYIVLNFSQRTHAGYRLKVDRAGEYQELIHTDEFRYGGKGNVCGMVSTKFHAGGPCLELTLAPFSSCILKRAEQSKLCREGNA